MVHENNGTWSLPGGWCDVDQSVSSNIEKEVFEESGLNVKSKGLLQYMIGESIMFKIMLME